MMETRWEVVSDEVRRVEVPGGWLYQVKHEIYVAAEAGQGSGCWCGVWHPPVFVAGVPSDGASGSAQ